MRRTGRLFERVIDRENLRLAVHKALRGKRSKGDARAFMARLDENLEALRSSVERGDVVRQINGRVVRSLSEYALAMREVPAGQMIRLLVRRKEDKHWRNYWLAFPKR